MTKLYKNIFRMAGMFLPAVLAVFVLASCSDDEDNAKENVVYGESKYQVFFVSQPELTNEVKEGETTDFIVTIAREDSSKVASVSLEVTGNEEFEAPSTIEFAEGESKKNYIVHFKGSEQIGEYECNISIKDATQYDSNTNFITSVTLKVKVVKNPIYFTCQPEFTSEVRAGETANFTVTIARDNATIPVLVPICITGNEEFDAPSTIEFAEGESEKSFDVFFKGSEKTGDYVCNISCNTSVADTSDVITTIPSLEDTLMTSVTFRVTVVEKWEVLSESVHFAPYYKKSPDFDAQLLKLKGENTYCFKNFMVNYDLIFNIEAFGDDGNYYIKPVGGYYAPDWFDWGYNNCWHMGDDENNPWILYYNGDNSGNYYAWCFLFTGKETDGWTYINFNKKTGCIMWDYSLYDANDNYVDGQWDYLMFNWE